MTLMGTDCPEARRGLHDHPALPRIQALSTDHAANPGDLCSHRSSASFLQRGLPSSLPHVLLPLASSAPLSQGSSVLPGLSARASPYPSLLARPHAPGWTSTYTNRQVKEVPAFLQAPSSPKHTPLPNPMTEAQKCAQAGQLWAADWHRELGITTRLSREAAWSSEDTQHPWDSVGTSVNDSEHRRDSGFRLGGQFYIQMGFSNHGSSPLAREDLTLTLVRIMPCLPGMPISSVTVIPPPSTVQDGGPTAVIRPNMYL